MTVVAVDSTHQMCAIDRLASLAAVDSVDPFGYRRRRFKAEL